MAERPDRIYATAATADRDDAGIGVIWWAAHPPGGYALTVLDYTLDDMSAINADWIGSLFSRSAELIAEHRPARYGCQVRLEHPGLIDVLKRADAAFCDTQASRRVDRPAVDINPIAAYESAEWAATLDERTSAIRPLVNSGKVVKLETGLRRFSFRAIRTNHLISQIKRHTPGDAASAGELLHAFVLGVLLGTTPPAKSWFEHDFSSGPTSTPSDGPFSAGYLAGRRPL